MESDLSRRDFLERTALAAGMAGERRAARVHDPRRGRQAPSAGATRCRRRATSPIDHFVILMMENRSFDHYFGWLRDADAAQHQSYPDATGPADPDAPLLDARHRRHPVQGLRPPRPGPRLGPGRAQLNGGFLAPGSGNDEFALTYFNQGDLGFIHEAARNYTTYDRYFCSLLASDLAEPLLQVVGAVGRAEEQHDRARRQQLGDDLRPRDRPRRDARATTPPTCPSPPCSAAARPPGSTRSRATTRTALTGTLPNITIVDPPFRDGGGGDGLSADEHPLGDVRLGQAFMADVVNAFVNSPELQRGALFVIYDEWGGFFDHVRPPRVPDDRASTDLEKDFGQMGFRVPAVAVSPYARRAKKRWRWERDRFGWHRNHFNVDHGQLRPRVDPQVHLVPVRPRRPQHAHEVRQQHRPQLRLAGGPTSSARSCPTRPRSSPSRARSGAATWLDSQEAHASDLADIEHVAERYKLPVYEGKMGDIFTLPDTIKKGVARPRPGRPAGGRVRVRAHGDETADPRRAGRGRGTGARRSRTRPPRRR